jgi:hypothetical protein
MKKALESRIKLANKYIQFAMDNDLMEVSDYLGSTSPTVMHFEKLITVSKTGRIVTVSWKDGYDFRPYSEKFNTNNEDNVDELKYIISGIIRAVKKSARAEKGIVLKF